jgi:predicted neuraminidase
MAITRDDGRTWQFARPLQGYGVEQPCLFERKDGTLVAYFRDSSELHKIRKSESSDQGFNWSPIAPTDLPNPGSGIDVLRLKNGLIALVYNDVDKDPRSSIAISLSDDEGRTWKWTRHLEQSLTGRYDYPSMIQSTDGLIHVTYSVNVQSIKHVTFNEDWIKAGN